MDGHCVLHRAVFYECGDKTKCIMDAAHCLAVLILGGPESDIARTAVDCLSRCARPYLLTVHLVGSRHSALDDRKQIESSLRHRGSSPTLAERVQFDLPAPSSTCPLRRVVESVSFVSRHPGKSATHVVVVATGCRCVDGWDDIARAQCLNTESTLLAAVGGLPGHSEGTTAAFPRAVQLEKEVGIDSGNLYETPPRPLPLAIPGTSLLMASHLTWTRLTKRLTRVGETSASHVHELAVVLGMLCFEKQIAPISPSVPLVRHQRHVNQPVVQLLPSPQDPSSILRQFSRQCGIDLQRKIVYGQGRAGLTRTASVFEVLSKTGRLLGEIQN